MPHVLSRAIARHVVDWRARPWPLDWGVLFGREAPLSLEIGFGNGGFLAEEAVARPDRNHIGIELSWSGATRLLRRMSERTSNVRVLLIDAEVCLTHLIETESLSRVYANHPCPWPKTRHEERRLFTPDFLNLLTDRMRPGARLRVVTDHAEYREWLSEMLAGQSALGSCFPTPSVTELPEHRPTKYQLKAMADGTAIHYFEWEKRSPAALPLPPTHHDPPSWLDHMPSVTLRGPFKTSELLDAVTSKRRNPVVREEHDGIQISARLGTAYAHTDSSTWLVECMVTEDKLRQEFAILVAEKQPGELLLKLSSLGRPHPTYGVKRALAALAQAFREAEPRLELGHENLGHDLLQSSS